jgi:LuxR family transcriptional regulator, maltose regulon positive regulatory protein
MDHSDVLERIGQLRHASGLAWDISAPKPRRPRAVWRLPLIERLAGDGSRPIVSVVAPAGYGKTTLLAQWAEHDGRAFAWVLVDEAANDPKVLLGYVARALDAVEPIGARVFDALASPGSSVPGSVVPRLGSAFWSMSTPVVLVLDDVGVLRDSECRAALSVLADHVPPGSQLALASRVQPPLPIARLRAAGKTVEIGPADLALTREEAASLLRNAGAALGDDEVTALHQRTEGWAAGLYIAALYLKEGGTLRAAAVSFGDGDRFMTDYMEAEFLARIGPRQRAFLTRTAVLERMCGPLCDAVLDQDGSAGVLADLGRSDLLLVPLDRRGKWYRYHHLFRDMLLTQAERLEPGLIPVLRRRAASWCLRNGLAEEALEYSMAAGDVDAVAGLAEELWRPAYWQGRRATVRRWLGWLEDRGVIETHPMIAVLAAIFAALTGRPADAERWADVVDRWQDQGSARRDDPTALAWAAQLRAGMCRRGAGQMRADADQAVRRFAAQGIVTPTPMFLQGIARVLCGDPEGGAASLRDAAQIAENTGADEILALVLGEKALLATARGDWGGAETLAGRAGAVVHRAGLEDSYVALLVSAVRAHGALHRADVPAARQQLVNAQRLRPELGYEFPHVAVQVRIELARVHLALGDLAGAQTLMREIDELLRRRPGLGTLIEEVQALRGQLSDAHGSSVPGASALTAAELRLLPLLATHLTFGEIAGQMFLSPHTVKSQAVSIYRKLGAASRSQAVARSRELGLLEGLTILGPDDRRPQARAAAA